MSLDEDCCRFAGIEANIRELCNCGYPKHEDGCEMPVEVTYPAVSTEGMAMLWLMKALEHIGVFWKLSGDRSHSHDAYVRVIEAGGVPKTGQASHASAPMALALAVKQLAKEST